MNRPKQRKNKYTHSVNGVFGEFGAAENRRVRYIQGNLLPDELESFVMVSDIPGNKKWSIRELFQREVDDARVENGIIPYLKDPSKVKFFNPLTFVLLEKSRDGIVPSMPPLQEQSFGEHAPERMQDHWLKYYEAEEIFRLKHDGGAGYAELEWNQAKAEVVAIDGQHRLLALKRIQKQDGAKIAHWRIPVVILLISPEEGDEDIPIIDSVRKLFLYINKEARQPNRTREIVLDEERFNEMCVQELLERGKQPEGIPLLAYDWRGTEIGTKRVVNNGHTLFSAEGMHDWLKHYILGGNYTLDQRKMLGIGEEQESLYALFEGDSDNPAVSEENAEEIRKRFRERIMPGITHFVREFKPYKGYVRLIQTIEKNPDDDTRDALDQIRFGGTAIERLNDHLRTDRIAKAMSEIKGKLRQHKESMPHLLVHRDIGALAVFYAFGYLYDYAAFPSHQEYAASVTNAFNKAWAEGDTTGLEHILSMKDDDDPGIFHHIIYDHEPKIMNNRLTNVHKGLGALIALVVAKHWKISNEERAGIAKDHLGYLKQTLIRGYKREVRSNLDISERLPARINEEATQKAEEQIRQIQNAYGFGDVEEGAEDLEDAD